MNNELNINDLEQVSGGGDFGAPLMTYVTKQNDTLWDIAQTFRIDVHKLFQLNYYVIREWFKKMNPGKPVPADDQLINYLYVGMSIKVPA